MLCHTFQMYELPRTCTELTTVSEIVAHSSAIAPAVAWPVPTRSNGAEPMITNKMRLLLVDVLCLALWPAVAYGQSPELMAAYERSNDLYAQGRYQEALPFAEEA